MVLVTLVLPFVKCEGVSVCVTFGVVFCVRAMVVGGARGVRVASLSREGRVQYSRVSL